MNAQRPVALVTGASRQRGIGSTIARALAASGWDIAVTYWRAYDESMPWGSDANDLRMLEEQLRESGATTTMVEADLSDTATPSRVFDHVLSELGPVTALVLAHCEGVNTDLLGTSVEGFDRHYAVNARASWLLVREFGLRFAGPIGRGRIIGLTSDHVPGNVPYGVSKGALDRIVLAATHEFAHLGVTANVINPGATDTGWMTKEQLSDFARSAPLGRVGLPEDCARLVSFLCSEEGGWINGQLLQSNGGVK